MSLNIDLIENGVCVFDANITHNLNKMASELGIYEIVWHPEKHGITSAGLLIGPLVNAISDMENEPEKYTMHDSSNGWGTYEDFLPWLEDLLIACKQHRDANVVCSR